MNNRLLLIAGALLCSFALNTLHASTCQSVSASYLVSSLGDMTTDGVWTWDSYNYAKARHQGGGEDHLFTPVLDLSGSDGVTIAFSHVHRYAANPSSDYTLWVTADYKGSYAASTWKQLTISPYATNSDWKFVDVSIDVPTSYVGAKTVFCFKYTSTADVNGTWEVKNLTITSTCEGVSASPVAVPNVGEGRLKVCAQNLLNYYYNYNTGRGKYTEAERAEKTRKIMDAMLWVDADVYGFCELEAQDIILRQLKDSLNKRVKSNIYSYVADEINVEWDSYDNNLKSGFIYRNDKVKTIGSSVPAYTANYYRNTMRVQTFEELSSGERFTLSMNHFKSKAGDAEDQGNSTRVTNATRLIENLPSNALDKDILIMGDLNCEVGEDPLNVIENAGYTEQLLKYDASAYSHCYNGGELIDHVYANASMAAQITGAGVFHISTSCGADASANYGHRYSDHDPYLVGINLVSSQSGECEEVQDSYLPTGGSGLGDMRAVSVSGQYYWRYQSSYGATCADLGGEDWLLTPTYDLSQAGSVTLEFDHTIGYAIDMPNQQTLWVTSNFSDVASSEWTQLTIPTYPSGKNWTFVNTKVNVPLSVVGKNTVFGFKYAVPAAEVDKSPTWEIKNLQIKVSCDNTHSAVEDNVITPSARKVLDGGRIYILLPDGTRYNLMGVKM